MSSSPDGLPDLVDANGQFRSFDAGGQTRTTDADGQNQGATYLGPIDAAGLHQGLMYLGPDEERHGVDVTNEALTQSRIQLSLVDDDQIPDSQIPLPVPDNENETENGKDVAHADLAGFVNPPPRRTAASTATPLPASTNMNPSRFFPIWFGLEPTSTPPADSGNKPPTTNPTRWGDFDGSEHPFGDIPDGWTEAQKVTESHKSRRKPRDHIPRMSQSNNDQLYARFMASIVDGLDEHTQRVIRERADKMKNTNLNSEVNTDTTDSPKDTNMAHNDYNGTTNVIQVNRARDTGLLPDIFAL